MVTQDLCAVCAVDVTTVDAALAHLGCTAEVLTVDPHTLDEVLDSVLLLGKATGHVDAAHDLVDSLRARLDAVRAAVAGRPRPRVAVLEWTDPPYAPGHWIPEMVELAGGTNVLGAAGQKSVRITWDDVAAARPDVVVVAPCGYDRAGAQAQADAARATCCRAGASGARRRRQRRCGPARARGWSTVSRSWPTCCTRPDPCAGPVPGPPSNPAPGHRPVAPAT